MIKNENNLGWQKRVIDVLMPMLAEFAEKNNGTIRETPYGANVRVATPTGIITIQVSVHGKGDDHKLEVTGIRRSGIETKRSVFSVKNDHDVDGESFRKALDLSLLGE